MPLAAGGPTYSRVVMNLPASAITFLDAFRGACTDARWRGRLPTVHCYTFSKGDEDSAGTKSRGKVFHFVCMHAYLSSMLPTVHT